METEKTEVQKLQEEVKIAALRKELAELNAPAPSPQPIRLEKTEERKSKMNRTVRLSTSVAVMKGLMSKITGGCPVIKDEDYVTATLVCEIAATGDSTDEVISDPNSSRRPY